MSDESLDADSFSDSENDIDMIDQSAQDDENEDHQNPQISSSLAKAAPSYHLSKIDSQSCPQSPEELIAFFNKNNKSSKYSNLSQNFDQMNFGQFKYTFKKDVRNLPAIGPMHYMILKLESSEDFEDRINLIRNIESMIRLSRPVI